MSVGCTTVPETIAEEYNEEGVSRPEWAIRWDALQAKHAEEEKKAEEEYENLIVQTQAQHQAPQEVNKQACKINGHDCWEVVKLFTPAFNGTLVEKEEKLKTMGLNITSSTMYRDGGTRGYKLSDGTSLLVVNSLRDHSGNVTVTLPDGTSITYDTMGYQISSDK